MPGGCDFAEAVERDAASARLFWTAERDCSVLRVHAHAARAGFDVTRLDQPCIVLSSPAGSEAFLARHDHQWLRIDLAGGSLLSGAVSLEVVIGAAAINEPQLAALRLLAQLQRDRHIRAEPRHCDPRLRREILALRVHDARSAGIGMHEIACEIFGPLGASSWSGPSDFLKSRIRRLAALGLKRSQGSYRDLLG